MKAVFEHAAAPALITLGLGTATALTAIFTDHSMIAALGGIATTISGGYTALVTWGAEAYRRK